jgi:transposase InsO family protein
VDQRVQFIAALQQDPKCNFTELCARFGISRPSGYALVARYNERGAQAFEDRRPVARLCPHRTAGEIEDRIVALRKQRPYEGPKKIRTRLLALEPGLAVPAASTIGDILDRRGLIAPRRARLRVPPHPSPLEPCSAPNELWCVDFKGHFGLGDKKGRCHPLTITDAASRYLITCEGLASEKEELARPCFERAFAEFGLPARIRSDNGAPFASRSLGGLSRLSVWWIRLGILPERIEPGHPEQNPRHERMHKTLKQATASPPSPTLHEQQRAFDYFRADYNNHRPHEALGQTPPARHYEPSWRPLREPRDPEYGEGFLVRRVGPNGYVSFRAHDARIGTPLLGQPLGFKQTDEEEWEIYFGPLLIGYALLRKDGLKLEAVA